MKAIFNKKLFKKILCCFCSMIIFSMTILVNTKPFQSKAILTEIAIGGATAVGLLACAYLALGVTFADDNNMYLFSTETWSKFNEDFQRRVGVMASDMAEAGKNIVSWTSGEWDQIKAGLKDYINDYQVVSNDGTTWIDTSQSGIYAGLTYAPELAPDGAWDYKNTADVFASIRKAAGTYTFTIGKSAYEFTVGTNTSTLKITLSNGMVISAYGMIGTTSAVGDFSLHSIIRKYDTYKTLAIECGALLAWDNKTYDGRQITHWSATLTNGTTGTITCDTNTIYIQTGTSTRVMLGNSGQYPGGIAQWLYETMLPEANTVTKPDFGISIPNYQALDTPATTDTTMTIPETVTATTTPADLECNWNLTYDMSIPKLIFTTKFPFSIPYDLYHAFSSLAVPAVEPVFDVPLKLQSYGIDQSIRLDFHLFTGLIAVIRWGLSVLWTIGLILETRKLIGE